MPYIGRSTDGFGVRNRFLYLASASDTSVSGADANGATLTFTDGAYVDVYLNGVLLKPTTDYNTSTANTIAGLSALNTNDEVTVVVYDVFTVADMVSATSGGTFSGAVTANSTLDMNGTELILDADADTSITADTDDQIDIKVAGSDLAHITSTYAKLRGATPLVFGENNSTGTFQSISGEVGANNLLLRSYQSLTFKNGTSGSSLTDGTTAFNIDSAGHVTMPLQPIFLVSITGTQSNMALATAVTVVANSEIIDKNGDFSSNTFTAPVTGTYFFNVFASLKGVPLDARYINLFITGSNRNHQIYLQDPAGYDSDPEFENASGSAILDMDANDTASLTFYQPDGNQSTDISELMFSGFLIA